MQAGSVPFDRDASVEKTVRLTREAAATGAVFVVFPEAFIPGYPRGFGFGMKVGSRSPDGREVWRMHWEQSVDVPGPETDIIGAAVREAGIRLAIGVIERESRCGSGGTLYNTIVYFSPDGQIEGIHRKLKLTGAERLIWGEGDGSTLTVLDTPIGRIGGLICWENYMPLARMALYGKGVDIYIAPTADARDSWHATMRHIACEGRCHVLGCNQYVTKDMYPDHIRRLPEMEGQPDVLSRGGSVIVSPYGETLSGPLYDREGMLTAALDPAELVRARLDFDVAGHYSRPDVFRFTVNERANPPVAFDTGGASRQNIDE